MQLKINRFRAFLFALLAPLLLVGIIIGCKGRPTANTTAPRPHEGVALRVACPDKITANLLEMYGGKTWAKKNGATLEVSTYERGTAPPDQADIWVFAPCELGRWANAGKLEAVPESYRAREGSYNWTDLLWLYRERVLLWGAQRAYAMPFVGEAPLCFYRIDRFNDPEAQKRFAEQYPNKKLAPPTTWEEFTLQAEFFHKLDGKPSLPPLPADDDEFDRLFYSVAAPFARKAVSTDKRKPPYNETFSFHYDAQEGQCRIETPGFVRALELLQRMQAMRPPEANADPSAAFAEGNAVLCLGEANWIDRFHKGKVKGQIGVCQVPGSGRYYDYSTGEKVEVASGNRVPYLGAGGWLVGVKAGSPNATAAWAMLADLSSGTTSRQIVFDPQWGGGAYRNEHFSNEASWNNFHLPPKQKQDLIGALRQTLTHPDLQNPVLRLRTPEEREYMEALVAEVRPALLEKKLEKRDARATILAAVAQRWKKLDDVKDKLHEEKDGKTRRAEYELNLGLQPEK